MQILLIMLIVVLLAFLVLLLALAKQSPREKQTEDKEQEEYIRDYAETVRQTGGSMKKLEHWKVIAIYLIIYDMGTSFVIELLQLITFRGLFEFDDIIHNGIGCMMGAVLGSWCWLRMLKKFKMPRKLHAS